MMILPRLVVNALFTAAQASPSQAPLQGVLVGQGQMPERALSFSLEELGVWDALRQRLQLDGFVPLAVFANYPPDQAPWAVHAALPFLEANLSQKGVLELDLWERSQQGWQQSALEIRENT